DLKPWIGCIYTSDKGRAIAQIQSMVRPRADERNVRDDARRRPVLRSWRPDLGVGFENRSERDDVVVPEDGFDFGEVGFREVRAGVDGAIVDTADFERQRIGLRRNNEICAERREFGGEAIANVEGNA